jgi:photosystem II stability/assembly factor-like uncharacterized protein
MKKLIVLILLVISMQIAYSKWEKCPNWKNEGYHIYSSMYLANNIIYVVFNNNTILISKDEAASWIRVNTSYEKITSITIKDDNIWIATNNGVFVSQDEGKTWEAKNNGLTDLSITAIEQNNGKIFIATKGNFYVSEDNGENWIEKNSGLPSDLVTNFIKINSANDIYLGTSLGVYYSSDNGNNWNYIGPIKNSITCLEIQTNKLYVGIRTGYEDGGLYQTSDNGNNWTKLSGGKVLSLLFNKDRIFVGYFYSNGLRITTDEGKTWDNKIINHENEFKEIDLGPNGDYMPDPDIEKICQINNKIITFTQNGIFATTDYGETWITSIQRVNYGMVSDLFVNNGTIYVATYYSSKPDILHVGNLLASTDGGETWTKINKDPLIYRVRSVAVSGDTIFAGTDGYGLFYSTDKGGTWEVSKITDPTITQPSIIKNINNIYSIVIKNNNIIVGTYGGLYLSKDRGMTWERWYLNDAGYSVFSIVNKGDEYFAATSFFYGKAVFKTNGIGNDWIDLSNKFNIQSQSGFVYSLFIDNNNIYALITGSGMTDGVYLSTDDGASWNLKAADENGYGNGWNDMTNPTSIVAKDGNVFVGTKLYGIFVSTDNGETWSKKRGNKNDGLLTFDTTSSFAEAETNSLVTSGDYLYAALTSDKSENFKYVGVFKIKINDITDVQEQNPRNKLTNLFPNPAQTTTHISLPKEGDITISAVDVLGRSFPLWSGYASAGDKELDVSALPTGSYTLLIDYGTKREALRMIKQ